MPTFATFKPYLITRAVFRLTLHSGYFYGLKAINSGVASREEPVIDSSAVTIRLEQRASGYSAILLYEMSHKFKYNRNYGRFNFKRAK